MSIQLAAIMLRVFCCLLALSPIHFTSALPSPAPPNCTIRFFEEGSSFTFHKVDEVEPGTFVVHFNATKESNRYVRYPTKDSDHFLNLFGDESRFPPYARFSCSSTYPTDFEFEGVGALDFFRVWKGRDWKGKQAKLNSGSCKSSGSNCTTIYKTNAEVMLTPQATGKYIFYSVADKSVATSYFIFAEAESKPFLIGASSTQTHLLKAKRIKGPRNTTTVILPCVTSNYNVTVNLYMRIQIIQHAWLQIRSKSVRYDPKQGFIGKLKPGFKSTDFVPGVYKCTTGDDLDEDAVLVDLTTPRKMQENSPSSALDLRIVNTTAICRSSDTNLSTGSIKMSNMYSRNPTESRLLVECMKKGNSYCGTHSWHQRKEADGPTLGLIDQFDCQQPKCAQISFVHPEGLLYCSQGDQFTVVEYFTGLDGLKYNDWKSAPSHALLRPFFSNDTRGDFLWSGVDRKYIDDSRNRKDFEYQPQPWLAEHPMSLRTGIPYHLRCPEVGLLVKDPAILTVTYSDGRTAHLADLPSWIIRRTHSLFLTPNMVGISCSDHLWTTDEMVTTSMRIEVESVECQANKFMCESNHQCIPEILICNNRRNCPDASDERNTTCQKFRPHIETGPDHVEFEPGTRAELICDLGLEFPTHLRPRMEWHHNSQKITDQRRIWSGANSHSLLLKFENVSAVDEGEYACIATNKFGSDEYRVRVLVGGSTQGPGTTTTTSTTTSTQGPTFRTTVTGKPKQKEPVSTTNKPKPVHLPLVHIPHHIHAPPSTDEETGHSAMTAGVVIIVLVISVALVGVAYLGWKYHKRFPGSVSGLATRMRSRSTDDGQQIVAAGSAYTIF